MVLFDVKCLKINDNIHTRGFTYWKSTRKVFCTEEDSYKKIESLSRKRTNDDSDENDEIENEEIGNIEYCNCNNN